MSTAARVIVYVNGDTVDAKEGSVEVELGGLEGEAEMSTNGYVGTSYKPVASSVELEIIVTAATDQTLWDTAATYNVVVEYPDIQTSNVFSGMKQQLSYKVSSGGAKLKFCGPKGQNVAG